MARVCSAVYSAQGRTDLKSQFKFLNYLSSMQREQKRDRSSKESTRQGSDSSQEKLDSRNNPQRSTAVE